MIRTGGNDNPVGETDRTRLARQREVDRQTRENLKPLVSPERGALEPADSDTKGDAAEREHVATPILNVVEVGNFEKSGVFSDDDVREVLADRLPESHVKGLGGINYVDEYRPVQDGVLLGEYVPHDRQIEVFRQVPEGSWNSDEMEHTLVHETGHHVYHVRMSESDRELWDDLSRGSGRTEYVSDYAKEGTGEDFAESYWCYVRNPDALADASSAKHAYMENLWQRH